jgi:hypothetical protein
LRAGSAVKEFRLTLQGRRVAVRAIPAMRLTVDADPVASGDDSGNQLRGEVTLLRGTYSKDVEVTLSDLLERSRPGGAAAAREPWKERTTLDVGSCRRRRSKCATTSRGSPERWTCARADRRGPGAHRAGHPRRGRRLVFSDIRYEIEAGTLTFSNTARIAPFVDRARAEVRATT